MVLVEDVVEFAQRADGGLHQGELLLHEAVARLVRALDRDHVPLDVPPEATGAEVNRGRQ